MKVFLFRHGEVENPHGVLYGRLSGFHLSENGCEQVKKSAERLLGKGIVKIYSSPLERTVETSQLIAGELGIGKEDIIIDDRLIESDLSKWQGTPVEEYKEKIIFQIDHKNHDEYELITHAGARVLSVLNGPVKSSGVDCIVVSHGDPIVGVLINLTGDWTFVDKKNIKNRYIKRAEFVELELKNGAWEIVGYSY